MSIKKTFILVLAAIALSVVMPADASKKIPQYKQFQTVKRTYGAAIRWNEFEMAWSHVDPVYRKQNPLTSLDKERFKQIQITGYDEKTMDTLEDGTIEQEVEIHLINRNTQTERIISDTQIWRWDPASKRWWLSSGLPDFTAKSY